MRPGRAKRTRKPVLRSGPQRRSASRRRAGPDRSVRGTVGLFACIALLAAIGVGVVQEEASEVEEFVQDVVWNGARVRVDVENGGGVTGMARAATDLLRPAGFDVVKYGNASSFDPDLETAVIDRVGRNDQAQAVAKVLGIDNVLSEPDPNLYVDVTVVLGRAWDLDALSGQIEMPGSWSWWDPRGWFGT